MDRFEKHLDKIIDEVLNEAIQDRADDIVQSINKRVVQNEQLVGGQKKLDKNKNHKIDSEDFKLMRMNKKRDMKEYTMGDVEPDNDVEPYGNFDTEKVKIGKVKNSGYKYEKKVGKEFNEEEMEEGRHSKKEREAFINYIKNSMGKRKEDRREFDDRPSEVVGVYSNIDKQRMEEEEETVEGNKFSGELAKAKKDGKKSFTVDGKTYPVKENTQSKPNTNVQLTEDELISLIEKLVLEQYMKPQKDTAKVGKENDTINKDHIDAMVKKMKQYLKDASEGEYEMNPENFPQGNGEMKEMPKKAYKASDAVEEYIDAFAYPGMTNLVYDEIKPNDEWIEANLKGSSKTGNAQVDQDGNALGNVVPTKTGEKMYKNFKDNVYGAEQMNASYKRYPQPVDQAGESTEGGALALKKGSQKSEKIFQKLESTEDKSQKLIKEQIDRMKNMVSYNQKTQ